ncbi:hypothetical protein EB796_020514 [Bugula neritina]|uniref:Uncharacterized protein n=1 Tax=Bugula neritina TaxID=10212 RepID=A0A7J7J6Y2_BUGNE|nr:hypothetical protein EB796_020514 [Bugula neritina]
MPVIEKKENSYQYKILNTRHPTSQTLRKSFNYAKPSKLVIRKQILCEFRHLQNQGKVIHLGSVQKLNYEALI